nr:uncharacterized protein LOC131770178 [Pocillopora verrucosa]
MGNKEPFGGVSLITVGDLFQLKPVFDKWIFENSQIGYDALASNIWAEYFNIESTEIMRQKDDKEFAELLNRLREGKHSKDDIALLKQRFLNCSSANYRGICFSRAKGKLFVERRRSGEQQVMHTPEQRRMEDKNIQGRQSGEQQVMHTPEQRRMEDKNIQGRRSGEQQVMHTPEQRRMEDKNIQGRRSGKQQVMHTPEQRRMEDKNIQGPSTDEKKSDEEARQVSLLQDELRKCRNDLKTKDREIESLIKRVARFNEMQTKRDQRNVEDTLSLNRPSLVERDFWQLKTEERVDALEVLRKRYENEIDVFPEILTCIIFEAIYEHMLETRSLMVEGCKEITKMAVKDGPWLGRHFLTRKYRREEASVNLLIKLHSRGSDCPRQVMDSLLLAIKESASELDVDEFTKDSFLKQIVVKCEHVSGKRLLRKIPWKELLLDLADYVKKLVKLTWRMVTQLPPLRLEYHKTTFNSQYHIMAGSDHKDKVGKDHEKPVCYLWPGLLDGGGRVIRVGEVTVRQSS